LPHTIPAGTRLGPYEISELIGRGGMGEVYRAKDGRLGRQVAIKVLPKSFAADADRLKRFEREARSAGQLNHPNVVAIYDVGTTNDTPYIVSELLDGVDLRTRLATGGALAPKKAIAAGIQIAKGLAAAHAKGIAHRDLKPENLMVLTGDHVKIVDFGLAKLTHADDATPDSDGTAALSTQLTGTGQVMGTASYMAPEQIRQQPTDQRADIFALGAILYEMLTGKRAFEGATPADRIAAILNATPPDLPPDTEDAAPGVSMLIERCLEKNVENRFQSAHDLVIALQLIETAANTRRPTSPTTPAGIPGAIAATETKRHTFRRTTYREGHILTARLAPDGQAICYGGAWEGRPVELFWAYPGNPESRALGYPRTDILAISPSGEMAVALRVQARGGFISTGMLARMPAGGGAPREILDGVQEADWSPDGQQLAVVREEAGFSRIEYPIGKLLYRTPGWISDMRVSRDGKRVAFLYHPARGDDAGGPAIVDLNGEVRTLSTGWSSARGLAWSPDGSHIVFTAFRMGVGRSLYRVTPDGAETPILEVPGHMTIQDISRQGAALIMLENERTRMQFVGAGDPTPRDLSWLDWTLVRAISSDGAKVLFDETGVGGGPLHSVYLRGSDGSPAIRLGDGAAIDLSPDGQWALAAVGGDHEHLALLPVGAGEGRKIASEGLTGMAARFFPDGTTLCVMGHEEGKGARLYRMDPVTGKYEPFTDEGISFHEIHVSPDGRFVMATGPKREIELYPVAGGAPIPIPGMDPRERAIGFNQDGTSVYTFLRGELPGKVRRADIATGERTLMKELAPLDPTGVEGITSVRATRAGDMFAYSFAQRLNDLFVVEGLF
jgi:eukaryotic-like serine/threonine-protein kinase